MNQKPLFNDIGGYECQKAEAQSIADFFRHYDEYYEKGARLPRGVLFFGVPGTGKTLFAKAIANEANVPVFPLTTEEFYKDNNIAASIRKVFQDALDNAPSIVLIDEMDRMISCERTAPRSETDKQREALRALLTEIDRTNNAGVLVIATTNAHLRYVPPALVRNGRIEKHIEIDRPDKQDRKEIISIYLKQNACFEDINAEDIAAYTAGFTGADISALANEVVIHCINKKKKATFADFLEPIESIRTASIRKKDGKDKSPVIYHEIGHFIADYVLNGNIGMINVVPYGDSVGRYSHLEIEEKINEYANESYSSMMNYAIVAISGLVATQVFLGESFMGAANDIETITAIFVSMLKSGLLSTKGMAITLLGNLDFNSPYRDALGKGAEEYAEFLDNITQKSRDIMIENKVLVEILYKEVKDKLVLTHKEIEEIIKAHQKELEK